MRLYDEKEILNFFRLERNAYWGIKEIFTVTKDIQIDHIQV